MPKIPNQILRAFIAGSAYPALFLPITLLAISSYFNYPDFEWRPVIWILPLLLGGGNIIFWQIIDKIPAKTYEGKLWIFGLTFGAIFPSIGILNKVPDHLFLFTQPLWALPLGILFYAYIWRFIIGNLNRVLGLEDK